MVSLWGCNGEGLRSVSGAGRRTALQFGLPLTIGLLSVPVLPGTARAADECGPGADVTCNNDGIPATDANPYAGGITYGNAGQTVNLATGVAVNTATVGVNLSGAGTKTLNVASGVTVTTTGVSAHGIQATSTSAGAAGLTTLDNAAGTITTTGTGARGISFQSPQGADVDIRGGTIDTTGDDAAGIRVDNNTANGGAIDVTAASVITRGDSVSTSLGFGADAIVLLNGGSGAAGTVTVDTSDGAGAAPGHVEAFGDKARGIRVRAQGGAVEVTTGTVATHGHSGTAIQIQTFGDGADGDITVRANGAVSTLGNAEIGTNAGTAAGIDATSFGTGGTIDIIAGGVSTEGSGADAITAQTTDGSVTINTTAGTVSTKGDGASGVLVGSPSGDTMITTADVSTEGALAIAVAASLNGPDDSLTVDTTAGAITTLGSNAHGINAFTGSFFAGPNTGPLVVRTGDITTEGGGANAITAGSNGGTIEIDTTAGDVITRGLGSTAITVSPRNGAAEITTGDITVEGDADFGQIAGISVFTFSGAGNAGSIMIDSSAGSIVMQAAANARAISASSLGGPVTVIAGGVSVGAFEGIGASLSSNAAGANGITGLTVRGTFGATGEFGIGALILAATTQAGGVTATVDPGASVMGGWQSDPDTPGNNGAAAGLVMGGRAGPGLTALITNNGSVGAWSDLAIATADLGDFLVGLGYGYGNAGGGIEVANNGNVTGYFRFGAGANVFHNMAPTSLDLRDFADTDGDMVRDTERTAIADLGGPGALFDNDSAGVVRLLNVPATTPGGAVTIDATGAVRQTGIYQIGNAGVEQGHILNADTFRNAGIITLADGETGGSGPVVGDLLFITGGGTADVDGGGVFRSEGGALHIDTVLNEGGANQQSDMLVVDGTAVGTGGATRIVVTNAGGPGAETVGDGIKVIDVLDPAASDPDAFALAGQLAAGGWVYELFFGGIADPGDGDWYLRSTELRIATSLYGILPSALSLHGYSMLATFNTRLGDQRQAPAAEGFALALADGRLSEPGARQVWGRIFADAGAFDADVGPDFDFDQGGLQAGIDLIGFERRDGSTFAGGVYFGAGSGNAAVGTGVAGTGGHLGFSAYSLGLYGTHAGPGGWYLDVVGQATFYQDVVAEADDGDRLATDGVGYAASIETGYPVMLGLVTVEPQAQLVYQSVRLDDAADSVSLIDFAETEGLRGRLGLRVVRHWFDGRLAAGARPALATWVRVNLWNEYLGDARTTVTDLTGANPVTVPSGAGGAFLEFAGGLDATLGGNASLFVTTGVTTPAGDAGPHAWGGRAGFKVRW